MNKPPDRASPSELFGPPRIVEQTSDHAFGTWHHMLIVVWKRETKIQTLRSIESCVRALAKERGTEIGLLTIVEDGAPLPTPEARRVTADVLRGAPIKLSAMVFEGHGFRAAAVRGVITGIGLIAKTPYPHRTFATVDEAAAWIEKETRNNGPGSMLRDSIVRGVASLRQGPAEPR